MSNDDHVQFGCGHSAPEGWLNFDASPTLRMERLPLIGRFCRKNRTRFPAAVRYGDITKGLGIPDESCTAVYCSHVLEHLSLESLREALTNVHKMMKPGGVFRLVLPDLEEAIRQYTIDSSDQAAVSFMKTTMLGKENTTRSLRGMIIDHFGNSSHLWMWDFKSLRSELSAAGFSDIRRAVFGDGEDPLFAEVEEAARWENCLGIECRKKDPN